MYRDACTGAGVLSGNVKVKTLLEDMTKMKAGLRESEAKLEKAEPRIENNTGSLVQVKNVSKEVETQMTETDWN